MKDEKLFELAEASQELKDEIDKLEKKRRKYHDAIVKELEKRDIKSLTGHGFKITYVAATRNIYDEKAAKQVLDPKVYKRIVKPVIDPSALAYQVQQGNIDQDLLGEFVEVKHNKPYPKITPAENGHAEPQED